MPRLTISVLERIPHIRQGDDLADIILNSLRDNSIQLLDGDILVLTQKIVSKAEGRAVNLNSVSPSAQANQIALQCRKDARLVELVLRESKSVLRIHPGILIVEHRLGFVCANAGIDHSNVQGEDGVLEDWVLLLPEYPDNSAAQLRRELETNSKTKLGVLIIDSHGRAWRNGTAGVAIGLSGLPGLVDLRGHKDLFGQKLHITTVGIADELASAASLAMGQADEGTPVVHVRGFPYHLRKGALRELIRPEDEDLFR